MTSSSPSLRIMHSLKSPGVKSTTNVVRKSLAVTTGGVGRSGGGDGDGCPVMQSIAVHPHILSYSSLHELSLPEVPRVSAAQMVSPRLSHTRSADAKLLYVKLPMENEPAMHLPSYSYTM